MSYFTGKVLKFIHSKRKQIIFALFALICFILDKDNSIGILKSAAPAVVAAAASSAAASGTTATGAVAAGGAAASGTGAAAAGGASASAGTTTAAGTVANSGNAVSTVNVTASTTSIPNTGTNMNINNVPKNTNPNAYKSDILSSNSIKKSDIKSSNELGEATNKSSHKVSSKSEVETESKKGKNNRLNPELNNDKENEEEEETTLDNATHEITESAGGTVVGCVFTSIFLIIFSVPIIIMLLIAPTSSTMSQIDCSIYNSTDCVEESSSGSFLNKLKNLFSYGLFASNSEVVVDKITEVYNKINEEYNFTINLPLLSASLFADSENMKTEIDENNQVVITDKMLKRLDYIEDLARLQMIEDYVVYTCNEKEVDGNIIYYKSTDYSGIDPSTVEEGDCNSLTVGQTFKEVSAQFNSEEYFIQLESSELLDLIYADYVESDSLLISKIKNQYHLFNSLNLITEDEDDYGNVPLSLMYDEKVNLQTPLKGSYSITSPFGMRDGDYAGMHTGIDLVANDKNIYAAGTGVVTRSNVETEGGNIVEITHTSSNGIEYVTQYAHLSQRLVNVGETVNSGDIIGIMGDTGTMASGVHLHFSMWIKDPYELYNPKNLFSGATNY